MHRQILLIISLLTLLLPLKAQQSSDWRDTYNMYFGNSLGGEGFGDSFGGDGMSDYSLGGESLDNGLSDEQAELLDDIAAQPFNINTITQEQLEQLPFLTESEIEAIAYYVYRYGGMITITELRLVEYLPIEKARLLEHFLYVGEKEGKESFSFKNMLKRGNQSVFYAANVPFYERKGDVTSPQKGGYLGSMLKHQFRYEFKYGSSSSPQPLLRFGLVGANDAGEQFFSGRNTLGYDYYSYYFQLQIPHPQQQNLHSPQHPLPSQQRNRPSQQQDLTFWGRIKLKNFVAGCFRASFGMGLVINNNFSLGKSTLMASAGRAVAGLRPHTSTADNNYLHGVGLSVSLSNTLTLTAIASHRTINATIGSSDGNPSSSIITTILSSSYHRTQNEMNKKNAATQTTFGGNITWKKYSFTLGVSGLHTSLNFPLQPNKGQSFRMFYPEGKSFQNVGFHYSYSSRRLSFTGETAVAPKSCSGAGNGLAAATINTANWQPSSALSLTALYRFFAPEYTALYGKTLSESASVQNEHGIFLGANIRLPLDLTAQYYFDFAYFSFPKYQASLPSHSFDNILQLQWKRGRAWSAALRARVKLREYDAKKTAKSSSTTTAQSSASTTAAPQLSWKTNASLRLTVDYKPSKNYWTRLNVQQSIYSKDGERSLGYLAMLRAGCSLVKRFLFFHHPTADISLGYFDTSDYNSRIYAYERSLAYSFGYQMFYGRGLRSSLYLQAEINKNLSAALKFGLTKYFDRQTFGSGMEEVQCDIKNNLEFQLRYKF